MNEKKIKDLLVLEYEYRMISAREIIDSKQNILERTRPEVEEVGKRRIEIQKAYTNRNIIGEYLEEVSKRGWELVTTFEYNGIPHGGALVFKRLKSEKSKKSFEELENSFFEPINKNISELADEYEEKYEGKKAIWKNRLTNGFKKFINDYDK